MATIGKTNPYARQRRREPTDAEQRLWYHLRNRRLDGFKFRREVTVGPLIAEFACVETKVIIEADGGQHGGPKDQRRTRYFQSLGWEVLRFWNTDILKHTDAVLGNILAACEQRKEGKPSPCPLPHAGEGK